VLWSTENHISTARLASAVFMVARRRLSQHYSPSLRRGQKTHPCLIKAISFRKCIKNFILLRPLLQQNWLKVANGLQSYWGTEADRQVNIVIAYLSLP